MRDWSRLRHTAIGNLWAPLFSPDRAEGTRKVLTYEAALEEFPDTRDRLAKWPEVRAEIEANLDAMEKEYTPFADGLKALKLRMDAAVWERLALKHRVRMRDLLGIDEFVRSVRTALAEFCGGLECVATGTMSVADLSRLHGDLLDAYSSRRLLPHRRGV